MKLHRSHRILLAAASVILVASAGLVSWRQTGPPDEEKALMAQEAISSSLTQVQQAGSATGLTVTEVEPGALADSHPLPTTIVGRVLPSSAGPGEPDGTGRPESGLRHQWPGIHAAARFGGDAVMVAFDDPFNRYRITLDDGVGPIVLVTRPDRRVLRLSGLGPGPHAVRVEKVSESSGAGGLPGLYLPPDGEVLATPPPRTRQIEFIGDSDSVGYGNLSATRDCAGHDVFLLTDTQESYGPRVARHFGADYQLIAASGIGLVRNYGGANPDRTMPVLYPRALPDEAVPYASGEWAPRVVVVALGANDFNSPLGPGEPWDDRDALRAEFERTYVRFLRDLRARNPDALLLLGAWEQYGRDYMAAHRAALQAFRAEGDTHSDLLVLPEMELSACHWHPSTGDHEAVAKAIIGYIGARPALWED